MKINSEVQKPDDATLVLRRLLKATPERAFKAWTSPEHIQQWMRPEPGMVVPLVHMDLREGGKFRIQMKSPDGEYFTAVGEFREVKAPERLVYTWDWEKDGSGTEFGEVEGNPVADNAAVTGTDVATYTGETGHERIRPRRLHGLPHLFRVCARAGRSLGHVSVA
jgi:uncharacterized protein YndB with AHSA1/START domain